MMPLRRWIQAAVVAVLLALVLGRWMAVATADGLWARALGVGATHAQIHRVQTMLWLTAFVSAATWCVGNLYLVYRSIRSVHVPRKLGDLEILEAVPRRFLLYTFVGVGLLLAWALSHGAADWWYARALTEYRTPLNVSDAVLGRDLSYYLFKLPWQRTVHTFVTLLTAVVLAICVLLYAAIGAIRWSRRRLRVTDLARWHLAGLLCAFALMLFWGYRLEPAEYVAGIHDVPADTVLTAVRIPVARMLSATALLVVGGSALWFWSSRVIVITTPWLFLAVLSFAGHYIVPSFAGAVRSTEELTVADIEAERRPLTALAYGTSFTETSLDPAAVADPRVAPSAAAVFDRAPLWDGFAVTLLLDRVAAGNRRSRFSEASLSVYQTASDEAIPVYVAARIADVTAAEETGSEVTWEGVHAGPYRVGIGAVAILAHRLSDSGLPVSVPDLALPQRGADQITDVSLTNPRITVGPGITDFAVFTADEDTPLGVAAGGFWRRLGLAWALQSPQLVTGDAITDGSIVVWHRDVVERLNRFAPFVEFGDARAVVSEGRLFWLSNGYASAPAFPLAPAVRWRGEKLRYLRSSFVGVVEAGTGETAVHLLRDPDPLGLAWSQIAPQVIRPASQLPQGLQGHIPYPAEAMAIQLDLIRRTAFPAGTVERPPMPVLGSTMPGRDPYWWVGGTGKDTVTRLRLLAPLERRESGLLAGVLDGTVRNASPMLELFRADGPAVLLGPSQVTRRFTQLRGDLVGIDGIVRMIPHQGGVAAIQSAYASEQEGTGAPRVVDVAVGFGGGIGSGPTLVSALDQLRADLSPTGLESREWMRARQWFERLDSARRMGDWSAFGRAYEELRRLLVGLPDSAR